MIYGTPLLDRDDDTVGSLTVFKDLRTGLLSLVEKPVSTFSL